MKLPAAPSLLTRVAAVAAVLGVIAGARVATATEFKLNGHIFTVPDGFEVEQVAGPPLVNRPVSADFDERGRLYVTDSSGSNEPVEVQREKRPHRIVRLEDQDGDGRFDKSTVFADKLMFPEGALWFDGSLYVAAPPEIWKFTDADDDGVAEQREVWFDGKTLTHCANDLHGPYLGPDGWMYWCKGAFASQTYDRPGMRPLKTKAAHIFRRRPEGGPVEPVMTGGMDNPVEVVFTPGGERLFTTTFLVHPNQGRRDGMLHAVYGGAYGKDHAALDGQPRTGQLMPVLAHLGAAAPCGLARLESKGLGVDFQNNVLASLFNMHKVTRHVLSKHGATFVSETSDLLVSDNLDFHPTDVLEDADGSVIVVDTGGWFRLCCPTSQLEKPDVLGGIYRLRRTGNRRTGNRRIEDPRGQHIEWPRLSDEALAQLLSDGRFAVRQHARQRLGKRGSRAVAALKQVLEHSHDASHRLQAVWSLTRIDDSPARGAVRAALEDADETVRQAALHSISVRRDKLAVAKLEQIVRRATPHNRRAAAEALGRVGSPRHVPQLLAAVPSATIAPDEDGGRVDRFLEHSLIYAAIELNDPTVLQESIRATNERTRRAALIALDQLEGADHLPPSDVQPLLGSDSLLLNDVAWWIARRHPDWGSVVVDSFRRELAQPPSDARLLKRLGDRLARFSGSPAVQQVMAETLQNQSTGESVRLVVLDAMAASRKRPLPSEWARSLAEQLSKSGKIQLAAVRTLSRLNAGNFDAKAIAILQRAATDEQRDSEIRLRSLNLLPVAARRPTADLLEFVCSQLDLSSRVANRALAVDFLTTTPLNSSQLTRVARQLPNVGAMELQPLMSVFAKSKDRDVGFALVAALLDSPAATSLFPDRLQEVLAGYGEETVTRAAPLLKKIERENQSKLERVEQILAFLPQADPRRGLRVFQSTKASCIACHRRGYLGGEIGPDLNRIGQIRTERALLESIMFPSLTFVRNYEPTSIVTDDGRVFNGVIRDESGGVISLQLDAQKSVQIPASTVEQRRMGAVSIMPAGLEKPSQR